MASQIATLIFLVEGFKAAAYICVASLALLVWDHLITFDDEIKYFWATPVTWSRMLFFLNRYTSLIFTVVQLYGVTSGMPPAKVCRSVSACVLYGSFITITFVAIVLLMRVYALYKRQTLVARLVLAISFALWVIGVALLVDLYRQMHFSPETQAIVGGCPMAVGDNTNNTVLWRNYIPTLIQQTILAAMTVYKGLWQPVRGEYAKAVMTLLVRDGSVAYIMILLTLVVSITGSLVSSIEIPITVSNLILPVCSICTSRLLINLRAHLSEASRGHGFLSGVEMTGLYLGGYKGGIAPARGVEGATVKEIGNTTVIEVQVKDQPGNHNRNGEAGTGNAHPAPLTVSAVGQTPKWERWDHRLPTKDVRLPGAPDNRHLQYNEHEDDERGFTLDLPELAGERRIRRSRQSRQSQGQGHSGGGSRQGPNHLRDDRDLSREDIERPGTSGTERSVAKMYYGDYDLEGQSPPTPSTMAKSPGFSLSPSLDDRQR